MEPVPAPATQTTEFVDIAFTTGDDRSVIDAIRERDPSANFAYIVTPNVDHVVRLQRTRSDLWPAYRAAWMTLCDSRILARLGAFSGQSLPVLPGSDLTRRLFDTVIEPDDRIAILGGRTSDIETLRARYGLRDVRHWNPPMGFIDDDQAVADAVRFVIDSGARYHFLAVGSPQQELIAHRIARTGSATGIALCVGASLDFLTGMQSRAPVLMQRLSVEWLYRLGTDPARLWRRYLIDGPEIFGIARDWRRSRMLVAHEAESSAV